MTSDGSIVAKTVISDDSLCSSLKNSDDIELIKILRNEIHLHLPIETVTLTVSTSRDIISGRREKLCLKQHQILPITADNGTEFNRLSDVFSKEHIYYAHLGKGESYLW